MSTGSVGSVWGLRSWALAPSKSRRRCSCCKRRATHLGLGNGVCLISGCEWLVRMWCRDPREAFIYMRRRRGTSMGEK